jgi:hypothetical protein
LEDTYLHKADLPRTYNGVGDDVVMLVGVNPDTASLNTPVHDNFIVHTYTTRGQDGIVNKTGPFQGEALIPNGTILMEVYATVKWTMKIPNR